MGSTLQSATQAEMERVEEEEEEEEREPEGLLIFLHLFLSDSLLSFLHFLSL